MCVAEWLVRVIQSFYIAVGRRSNPRPNRIFTNLRLIVPTFVKKVTRYLCSRWFFFLRTNFELLTIYFLTDIIQSFKGFELKFEKLFHL